MNFDEFDKKMRTYETNIDYYVLRDSYMVVRLDGRGFTKKTSNFEKPFDAKFSQLMREVVKHLMLHSGIRFVYGYTQSDEISLLVDMNEHSFNRKVRKYNSILAGEASAKYSLLTQTLASFDSRVVPLPTLDTVVDYFSWREEDSARNALNGYCYWSLRKDFNARQAAKMLKGSTKAEKNELLYNYGINYGTDVPKWQKNGIAFYWDTKAVESVNKMTGEVVVKNKRFLVEDCELQYADAYRNFVRNIVKGSER